MYAVVTTGGKQYRVEPGSELTVERLAGDAGTSITFDRVLLVGDGEAVTVGTPTVEGASVSGTVLGDERGPKLVIFKFKQKVKYRRTTGHRQWLTRVRIDEISAGGRKASAKAEATKAKVDSEVTEPKSKASAGRPKASAKAEADAEKPKRTRKPAAKKAAQTADSAQADTEKPKRTRKPAAKKSQATDTAEE